MILSWLNEQLALPDAAPFSAVGWGMSRCRWLMQVRICNGAGLLSVEN